MLAVLLSPIGANDTCANPSTLQIRDAIQNDIDFFPPTEAELPGREDEVSMDVLIGIFDIRVTGIFPGSAVFHAGFETDMYWQKNDCSQSNVLAYACENRAGLWYFVFPPNEDPTVSKVQTTYTTIGHQGPGAVPEKFGSGCTSADFLRVSSSFHKRFHMTYHPFELHELEIVLEAQLPLRSIKLVLLDENPSPSPHPAPIGWTTDVPFTCSNSSVTRIDEGRGNFSFSWAYISCKTGVSRVDEDWLFNDFFLFLIIVFTNFFMCLGWVARPLSSITAEPVKFRELPLEMENRSSKTAFLALGYIFAVSRTPHGLNAGFFAGEMPASTKVYFIGLIALAFSSLWSSAVSVIAISAVRDREQQPTCLSALLFNVREMIKDGVELRHSSRRPDPSEEDPSSSVPPHVPTAKEIFETTQAFRRKISFWDFIVIVAVHLIALACAAGWLIAGYLEYVSLEGHL